MHAGATAAGSEIHSPRPRRLALQAAALFVFLLLVYNVNMRAPVSPDGLPSRFLPFSILFNRNLNLDWMVRNYLVGPPEKEYYLAKSRDGHYMSAYPVVTPIVITPLYVPAAFWVAGSPPADRKLLI